MTDLRRTTLVALALAGCVVAAGCWDRREPEQMAHVTLLAIDLDPNGLYEVTAQFASPFAAGGATDVTGWAARGELPFWTHSAKGRTPLEAIMNLIPGSPRAVSCEHVEVILISERLARAGIGPVMDLVQRYEELRLAVHSAVVDGDVKELLSATIPLSRSPGMSLDLALELTRSERSTTPNDPFLKRVIEFNLPGLEMFFPRVEVKATSQAGAGEQGSRGGDGATSRPGPPESPFEVSGGAAFRGTRMVGWVSGLDTRGWCWVRGKATGGTVIVQAPGDRGLVSLAVAAPVVSSVRPVVLGEDIGMEIRVSLFVRVSGVVDTNRSGPAIDLHDPAVVDSVARRFAEAIRGQISSCIARSRELGSDIFGFGNELYGKRPDVWKKVGHRWDEILRSLPVHVDVEVKVRRPGMVFNWSGSAPGSGASVKARELLWHGLSG